VSCHSSGPGGTIVTIDAETGVVLNTTSNGGYRPNRILVSPNSGKIYVTFAQGGAWGVIDTAGTLSVYPAEIPQTAAMVASADWRHLYISGVSGIVVVDTATDALEGRLPGGSDLYLAVSTPCDFILPNQPSVFNAAGVQTNTELDASQLAGFERHHDGDDGRQRPRRLGWALGATSFGASSYGTMSAARVAPASRKVCMDADGAKHPQVEQRTFRRVQILLRERLARANVERAPHRLFGDGSESMQCDLPIARERARVGPEQGSRQGGVHPSTPTRSSSWGNTRDASKYSSAIARAVREWRS
jgi:hypothetical protein